MLLLLGCEAPPPATETFSDAARAAFTRFEDAEDASLAEPILALLTQIEEELDMAGSSADRALTPEPLQLDDLESVSDHPDRDPGLAIPVAVAYDSSFPPTDHARIALLTDQTPVEPNSPDLYDRWFVEGENCFPSSCGWLRTENDVEKSNVLFTVPFFFNKDFRWIQLDEERSAMVARGWLEEPGVSEDGNTIIEQSYSMEFYAESDTGTRRLMVLWAETTFKTIDYDDETIAGTTRYGIDGVFQAYDEWLEEN